MVRWVPGVARTLPAGTVSALAEQSVTIPATAQYGRVIRGLADLLLTELKVPGHVRDRPAGLEQIQYLPAKLGRVATPSQPCLLTSKWHKNRRLPTPSDPGHTISGHAGAGSTHRSDEPADQNVKRTRHGLSTSITTGSGSCLRPR